jgi:Cys-tRNA(Pro)/Cys-tRNA(Cys) deacylase
MKKSEKTNALRLLSQRKIPYTVHDYTDSGAVSGPEVAKALGEDPEKVFKTLVTTGKSGQHYVFILPVCRELDLKKAAAAVGEKNVAMLPQKELLPLTGYVHGGCSPIGMKKLFPTVLDRSAEGLETLCLSGGRIGLQLELAPEDLRAVVPYALADLCAEEAEA